MGNARNHVDPYLFQEQYRAFRTFVEEKSGTALVSFASNPFIEAQEGYKYRIHIAGREALSVPSWKEAEIGSGRILESVIHAIELPENNLVPWLPRFGEEARAHKPLLQMRGDGQRLKVIEEILFRLYRGNEDEACFSKLLAAVGKKYSLLAYLFFLKDPSRYLPIATTFFDGAFGHLGVDLKMSHQCSWENYNAFLATMDEVKSMLREELGSDVTVLDAHSFVWILASQMQKEGRLAPVGEYLSLPATEREAIVKARVGQGRFRELLLEYWGACAVTACGAPELLVASHIKPWSKGTLRERLDPDNGLLLSPALDRCFDAGLVSFDQAGRLLISPQLSMTDSAAIGIHESMRLRKISPAHESYLGYHRKHIFRES